MTDKDAGNEPSFATPFLYNYVPGNNWKTVNQSRAIVDAFYSDARNGYPGNIDSGALPSWLIFNLIGLVSASPTTPMREATSSKENLTCPRSIPLLVSLSISLAPLAFRL